ncbi:uncharacterized protein MELLADRAFT_111466 [Melampsora larici-populina 98AG31]|uniref:Uncharacterized protein n=1 Tax=Melampsora larici-populina (strain 98AG31 / pathotype 3-4-7) TaxID=747676 RepID=F4S3A1_MELLP|nr:uncharacterized protein MELLADRAFT_111466 [Melampsora larici-populina 98AG31]EGG00780.1 hypothetical protein MELLADRAFT_111466 [Melampsora larici-populina 98AG31]
MAHPVAHRVIMYSVLKVGKIVPQFSLTRLCSLPEAETTLNTTIDGVTFYECPLSLLPDRSARFFVDHPGFFNLAGRFLPLNDHAQPILYYDVHSAGEVYDSFIVRSKEPRRACVSSIGTIVGLYDFLHNNRVKTKVVLRHTDYSHLDHAYRTFELEYLFNWVRVTGGQQSELSIDMVIEVSGAQPRHRPTAEREQCNNMRRLFGLVCVDTVSRVLRHNSQVSGHSRAIRTGDGARNQVNGVHLRIRSLREITTLRSWALIIRGMDSVHGLPGLERWHGSMRNLIKDWQMDNGQRLRTFGLVALACKGASAVAVIQKLHTTTSLLLHASILIQNAPTDCSNMPGIQRHSENSEEPVELAFLQLVAKQFQSPTEGPIKLQYPDGRKESVHRFGTIAYRVVDHDTASPKCLFTHFSFCANSSDEGRSVLTLQMVESPSCQRDFPVRVHIIDEMFVTPDAVQMVLGSQSKNVELMEKRKTKADAESWSYGQIVKILCQPPRFKQFCAHGAMDKMTADQFWGRGKTA